MGEPAEWDQATEALREALEASGVPYKVAEGEGAFYAPKIDVHVRDAIGRRWQISTLQVDLQTAAALRHGVHGGRQQRHRPFMIHRALFGSVERFFGILTRALRRCLPGVAVAGPGPGAGGARRPRGLRLSVVARLRAAGLRADTVVADEPLGGRIRRAKLEKLPYVLVVGDEDVAAGTVGVNPRGGEVERGVPVDDFVARLSDEVAAKA